MTKHLDDTVAAARTLPADGQDAIARVMLRLPGSDDDTSPVALSTDARVVIAASKAAATRGEFATDDQVLAVWAKHNV